MWGGVGRVVMEQLDAATVEYVRVLLNGASCVCGGILSLLILVGMWYSRHLMDRVSVRLTLGLAIASAAKALALLVYFPKSAWCAGQAFVVQWALLAYVMLSVAVGLNLQLVFVQGISFEPRWEIAYWVSALTLPTALSVVPLLAGKSELACEHADAYAADSVPWLSHLLWVTVGCTYCGIVAMLAVHKLYSKDNVLSRVKQPELAFAHDLDAKLNARSLVSRM
ncbi:hypothetical protein DSO57_1015427 [Entomophthora muscae]|uniref:Uncharacterized protein n=1 Tax=Entomophthora muscae TaxID=34485 RepID=A0ACC2T522_9FUNG|nr:hypothetical protein DSO57_1015427 [Entomophthora muscae]